MYFDLTPQLLNLWEVVPTTYLLHMFYYVLLCFLFGGFSRYVCMYLYLLYHVYCKLYQYYSVMYVN